MPANDLTEALRGILHPLPDVWIDLWRSPHIAASARAPAALKCADILLWFRSAYAVVEAGTTGMQRRSGKRERAAGMQPKRAIPSAPVRLHHRNLLQDASGTFPSLKHTRTATRQ